MFDSLFGEQAKLASAIDTYLQRTETLLRIKRLAKELDEPAIDKDMTVFIKSIAEATKKLLEESTKTEKSNDQK